MRRREVAWWLAAWCFWVGLLAGVLLCSALDHVADDKPIGVRVIEHVGR
jgi:hypothetical protein